MPKVINSIFAVTLVLWIHSFVYAQGQPDTLEAHSLLQKAGSFKAEFKYDSANTYLMKAANKFRESGVWHRFFYCHYNIGYNLSSQRKHQEALDHMLGIETQFNDKLDPARASTFGFYWQVGWAYFQLRQYSNALSYFDRVIESMDKCKDPIASWRRIRIVYDQGVIFLRLSQYEQAMDLMGKTLTLGDSLDIHIYDPNVLNNLGIIYRKLGEYKRSLNYYEQAFKLASKAYEKNGYNLVGLCPFYNNFSILYRELDQIDKSLESVKDGLELYEQNAQRWWSVYTNLKLSEIDVYFYKKEYTKALDVGRETLEYTISQGGSEGEIVGILRYIGKAFYYNKDYDSAEFYINRYLDFAGSQRSFIEGNAVAYQDLAEIYWEKGESQKALSEIQKGIILMSEGFQSQDLADNPTKENVIVNYRNLLDLLSHKTRYLNDLFENEQQELHLINAYKANLSARTLVSKLRDQLYYKSSKLALSEFANQIYEQGIVINHQLFTTTGEEKYRNELLNCFEGNRANLLAEAFQVSKVNGFTNLPDSLVKSEVSVYNQIAETEAAIIASKDSIEEVELRNSLYGLNKRYEVILGQKGEFQLNNLLNRQGLLISDIQNIVRKQQMVLEFFSGDQDFHLLTITPDSFNYYDLGPVSRIDSMVTAFVDQVKDPKSVFFGEGGYKLYSHLLLPALDQVNVKDMIIIPDGSLSFLPFEALTSQDITNPGKEDYLINDYTLRTHYSLALFRKLRERSKNPGLKTYIGFAPELDTQSGSLLATRSVDVDEDDEVLSSLGELPGAQKEVRQAADYFNGDAVIGKNATESYFKKVATGYNFIHLASHTLVDTESPLYSTLIFSSDDSGEEDGLLHLYELYGMRFNSELISLSACNTGVGRTYKGEGMMSLGRGFMGAGAKNVLMTLWSVSDQTSSDIMEAFFKGIKDGETEPSALRSAKLKYLENADELTSHPYYWSGYVFIGNGSEPQNHFYKWLIGIVILLGVLLIFRRIRAFV